MLTLTADFERVELGQNQESILTALREHARRETPRLIRPRLEEILDETIQQALTPQLFEGLMRDVLDQLFKSFSSKMTDETATKCGNVLSKSSAAASDDLSRPTQPVTVGNVIDNLDFDGQGYQEHELTDNTYTAVSKSPVLEQTTAPSSFHSAIPDLQQQMQEVSEAGPSTTRQVYDDQDWKSSIDMGIFYQQVQETGFFDFGNLDFENFHQELLIGGEQTEKVSHADSGYASAPLGDGEGDGKGKGKGKEVLRDFQSSDFHTGGL